MEFESFSKIIRQGVVAEKIDGTNGQIIITHDGQIYLFDTSRWADELSGVLNQAD